MQSRKITEFGMDFYHQHMMGPNSVMLIQNMLQGISLTPELRVLDLGCGKGLTSIYLAQEFGVQVFATDLWVSAGENYRLFKEFGLENQIIPLQLDATQLPFADEYFDAFTSVDAFQYFGNPKTYFDTQLARVLKPGALIAIAIPGMKFEIEDPMPEEMKPFWPLEALQTWHCVDWWRETLSASENFHLEQIAEMDCFDAAWNSWLGSDNPYAIQDRDMIRTDNGRFMNLISIIGRKSA